LPTFVLFFFFAFFQAPLV